MIVGAALPTVLAFATLLPLFRGCDSQNVCTFGNFITRNACGYKNEPAVPLKSFSWTYGVSCTPSKNTGPCFDHTGDDKGAYLFTEATYKTNGMTARWASPLYIKSAADSGGCVQFYYHMYGVDIGILNVYIYSSDGSTKSWRMTGEQGNQWLRADVELNYPAGANDTSFQVVFEGVISFNTTGKSTLAEVLGDIALDDVLVLTSGRCGNASETAPPTTAGTLTTATTTASATSDVALRCDFESDLCGFTDSKQDKGYWSRSKGKPFTPDTGFYAYFFVASTVKQGDSAILNSAQFTDGRCLSFSYVMRGSDVGQLNVYADVDALDYAIWSASGTIGDAWQSVKVALPDDTVAISFEGVRGTGSSSDIAVDNVVVSKTPCPDATQPSVTPSPTTMTTTPTPLPQAFFACNFDANDFCGLTLNGDFQWKSLRSKTRNVATGPSFDHTKQDLRGYFIIADAGYKNSNSTATATSSQIPVTGVNVCLKFYYHMYGIDIGRLLVRILSSDKQQQLNTWDQRGSQGDSWILANVDITLSSMSSVILEFTSELQHNKSGLNLVLSNIAVDDVILIPGSCASYPGNFTVDVQVLPGQQSSTTATTPTVTASSAPIKPLGSSTSGQSSLSAAATSKTAGSSSSQTFRPVSVTTRGPGSVLTLPNSEYDGLDIGIVVAIALSGTLALGGIIILIVLKHRQLGPFKNSRPFTIRFKSGNSKVDRLAFANEGYDGDVTIHAAA